MQKFLQNHKLTKDGHNSFECYLIEVFDKCEDMVDVFEVYCWIDVLRVQKFYLNSRSQYWWTVKVTQM